MNGSALAFAAAVLDGYPMEAALCSLGLAVVAVWVKLEKVAMQQPNGNLQTQAVSPASDHSAVARSCDAATSPAHCDVATSPLSAPARESDVSEAAQAGDVPLCGQGFRLWLAENGAPGAGPQYIETPVVGLCNQGENICYLNAILQCLLHTPMLSRNLTAACAKLAKETQEQQAEEETHDQDSTPSDDWLAELLRFFQSVAEARSSQLPVSASRIAGMLTTTNNEFARGRQADAHEAFMSILSKLLNGCLQVGDGSGEDLTQKSYQEKEFLEKASLVGHIFGMDLGQSVECQSCSYESQSHRVEYCLCARATMGLTEAQLQALKRDAQQRGYTQPLMYHQLCGAPSRELPTTDLARLLDEYTKREKVDFLCEKCHRRGGTVKRYFERRPNVLMVYIDRTQDTGQHGKINRHVGFEPRLDLTKYMKHPVTDPCVYSLYAIVVHKDINQSTDFGHYFAYVRDKHAQWFLLDDTRVVHVPWREVQEAKAYMLLYATDNIQPLAAQIATDRDPATASSPQNPQESRATEASATARPAAEPPASAPAATAVETEAPPSLDAKGADFLSKLLHKDAWEGWEPPNDGLFDFDELDDIDGLSK